MYIAYMDDAGDLVMIASPPNHNDQPVFALTLFIVNQHRLVSLVPDYIQLKRKYFPGLCPPSSRFLASVLPEIKGADLRRDIARGNRNQSRQAIRFLDEVMRLCLQSQIRIISRVFVKAIGQENQHTAVYTSACQSLFKAFEHYLETENDSGLCIADSRTKGLNVPVAHSIFTQMYSVRQRQYSRIVELPTFGHSDNHVGVQVCDLLSSALILPMAIHTYCTGHVANVHVQPEYSRIRARYTGQIQQMLYRFQDEQFVWRAGVTVSDAINHRPSSLMFQHVPTVA